MTILRDLSMLWSLFHILVLFIFLYESRYPKKKTIVLTCVYMVPLAIINVVGMIFFGVEAMSKLMAVTCTVPSFIFFLIMAKKRDAKFIFTFSLVDTIALEIIILTNIMDYYIPGENYIFMFISRLVAFPIMEWIIFKFVRRKYLEMQNRINKGWGIFAVISIIFYMLLIIMMAFPSLITNRPEYLPALFLVLILMPILYMGIYTVLSVMLKYADAERAKNILTIQTEMMKQRVEQMQKTEQEFRIQKHDIRHVLKIIYTMASRSDCDGIMEYVSQSEEGLCRVTDVRYCSNAVIDAVVSYYAEQAAKSGIRMELDLSIPEDLTINYNELSTVIANAFENAIKACEEVGPQQRVISLKCIEKPQFMMQISNPYVGTIKFDDNGFPVASKENHGLGSQSIAAFCEKNNAYCEYKTDSGLFVLRIAQM